MNSSLLILSVLPDFSNNYTVVM